MRDVARATSAAPTYFEPHETQFPTPDSQILFETLVDGGIFANNPAMCAYAEARRLSPGEEILLVSLGTGELTACLRYEDARDWGKVSWVEPLFRMIFDGASDTVHYQLGQLLHSQYYRFQPMLVQGRDQMDDTTRTNLTSLRAVAEELITEKENDLGDLCSQLTVNDSQRLDA